MNPSDEADDFLREAGAQWRAGQPSPPEPELGRLTGHGPRRWVPALAAASVAAIAAGALVVLPGDGREDAPLTGPQDTAATSNEIDPASLLVRDGDRVQVSGEVIAAPGRPVVFCAPHAESAIGYPPGQEPAPSCAPDLRIELTGVDVSKLSGTRKGVRFGNARLIGTWKDRTIAVQQQLAPLAVEPPGSETDFLTDVPCKAPSGGWQTSGDGSVPQAVSSYVSARPDQLAELWLGWPDGLATPSGQSPGTSVVVVQVVRGDLEQVHRELTAMYAGNLCVAPGKYSQTDGKTVGAALAALAGKGLGISVSGSVMGNRRAPVQLIVVDERAFAEFSWIGLDKLDLQPAVRPAR